MRTAYHLRQFRANETRTNTNLPSIPFGMSEETLVKILGGKRYPFLIHFFYKDIKEKMSTLNG